MSLTTDFFFGISVIHFDSWFSSQRYLQKEAEHYQKFLNAGNQSMADDMKDKNLILPLRSSITLRMVFQ